MDPKLKILNDGTYLIQRIMPFGGGRLVVKSGRVHKDNIMDYIRKNMLLKEIDKGSINEADVAKMIFNDNLADIKFSHLFHSLVEAKEYAESITKKGE